MTEIKHIKQMGKKKKEGYIFSNNNAYSTKLLFWGENQIKSEKIQTGIKKTTHSLGVDGYIAIDLYGERSPFSGIFHFKWLPEYRGYYKCQRWGWVDTATHFAFQPKSAQVASFWL